MEFAQEALEKLIKEAIDKGITKYQDIETYIVYYNPQYGSEYSYTNSSQTNSSQTTKINICGTFQCIYPYRMNSEYLNIYKELLKKLAPPVDKN